MPYPYFIKLQHTTVYPPQANGKYEYLHRTLKIAIKAHNNPTWSYVLLTSLFGLWTAVREDSVSTTAQMVSNNKLPREEVFCESKTNISSGNFSDILRKHL